MGRASHGRAIRGTISMVESSLREGKLMGPSVKPPDHASSPAIAASMRGNRSRDTSPEIRIRLELRRLGLRGYRVDAKWLPGRPDIVFTRVRVAVFIHGCFWHRCPYCNLPIPKTNPQYWEWKFRRNTERDSKALRELAKVGWRTVRLWSCQVSKSAEACAQQVKKSVENASGNF